MHRRTKVIAFIAVVAVAGAIAGLVGRGLFARAYDTPAGAGSANPAPAANTAQTQRVERADAELAARLRAISERAGGSVGVAVMHVESGRSAEAQGDSPLPLYSVFKLPLAVAVLKAVEENRLRLDQRIRFTPADIAPGAQANSDLWRRPVERSIEELLELSIARSDNTSTDKLLELVGGPEVVTRLMRAHGLQQINVQSSVRQFVGQREHRNTGAASDLARLLVLLQRGEILPPPQFALLRGMMERAVTGLRRLRGNLPAGTVVADKTGTGGDGAATNDVGLITLPEGRGHLAMAVLISGSRLPAAAQEQLIAELARAAYDAHVAQAASRRQ